MKKINVLIIAVIAFTAAFMTSCKNDPVDFAAPTVTFTEGNQTVNANTAVSVSGVVNAEGELKHVIAKKKIVSSGTVTTLEELTKFDNDTIYNFKYDFTETDVTESFTVEIEVTDKNDKTVSKTATITVNQGQPVVKFSGLKMYSASADQTGLGDYASLTIFHTWNHNQAENYPDTIAVIDVWYYNGNYTKDLGGHPHLVSPDTKTTDYNTHSGVVLSGAKTTKLRILTTTEAADFSDWANIDDDYLISSIDMSDAVYNVGDFAQGDIIAFELQDGKKGIMKAVGGTAGSGGSDYILVDVIVQEQASVK